MGLVVCTGEKHSVNNSKRDDTIFSASEVGQFSYCANSWFLKRKGYRSPPSKNKSHGKIIHDSIGKTTYRFKLFHQLSYVLIIISIILFFLAFFYLITNYLW